VSKCLWDSTDSGNSQFVGFCDENDDHSGSLKARTFLTNQVTQLSWKYVFNSQFINLYSMDIIVHDVVQSFCWKYDI
jgi:hypothetical protein